jgi:transcriptional regulator with GAF, ATPase, and Fis domain
MVALLHYDWPFNVRELESCIKRGVALVGQAGPDERGGAPLDTQQLPDAIAETMRTYGDRTRATAPSTFPSEPTSTPPVPKRAAPTETELRELLGRHRGNVAAVGRELGKERMQVHRWLKKFGISLDEYR